MKNPPHPRAGEGRGGDGVQERILMATGAALVGLFVVLYIVLPLLSELGHGSNLLWVAYTFVALGIPFGLLLPTVIRPRSVVAASLRTFFTFSISGLDIPSPVSVSRSHR